jgi:mono/diheme cytochrome c family protein
MLRIEKYPALHRAAQWYQGRFVANWELPLKLNMASALTPPRVAKRWLAARGLLLRLSLGSGLIKLEGNLRRSTVSEDWAKGDGFMDVDGFMDATRRALLLGAILMLGGLDISNGAPRPAPQQTAKKTATKVTAAGGNVDRGRYLVEEVARCPECHTPRNSQGDLERDAWLQGSSTWISPVQPDHNWAQLAPPLAGLPSYTDEQAERILEKGTGPEGEALRPPMHTYHLTQEDARAIIAYLRSLPRAQH